MNDYHNHNNLYTRHDEFQSEDFACQTYRELIKDVSVFDIVDSWAILEV